jgi:hypothetical protein
MPVSCNEHREGLLLLALKKRLAEERLAPREKEELEADIRQLEEKLKM